ncbi:hypothetical protein NPIL_23671 [Nephila pilipes]|uniref:Uncharacterized protein n=1 Tax=Nephila pilipes TaxID=299642 RepID=A0A8X6TVM6_NEPPI|nr:hypothetical protein NPIL_23671 [Nephila pilipes]
MAANAICKLDAKACLSKESFTKCNHYNESFTYEFFETMRTMSVKSKEPQLANRPRKEKNGKGDTTEYINGGAFWNCEEWSYANIKPLTFLSSRTFYDLFIIITILMSSTWITEKIIFRTSEFGKDAGMCLV